MAGKAQTVSAASAPPTSTAKGSGKSPLATGIGLYGMTSDAEARAEIYAAATKKHQSMILFHDAVSMVDQSALLAERLEKSGRGEKVLSLAHFAFGSLFRPISADDGASAYRVAGRNPRIQTRVVVDMIRAGTKSRRHTSRRTGRTVQHRRRGVRSLSLRHY